MRRVAGPALRVLITRPEPDAHSVADEVRRRGHDPVVAPVIQIVVLTREPGPDPNETWVFTSANGVRAAAVQGWRPHHPVFAVGNSSAGAARMAGYAIAGIGQSDAGALAALIAQQADRTRGIIHLAGENRAGDLEAELALAGLCTQTIAIYEARAVSELPAIARNFFYGESGAVLLFSARSARILENLLNDSGMAESARAHRALAFSESVANAARAMLWKSLAVASTPRLGAMLDLV